MVFNNIQIILIVTLVNLWVNSLIFENIFFKLVVYLGNKTYR